MIMIITALQYNSQNVEGRMGPKQPGPTVAVVMIDLIVWPYFLNEEHLTAFE